MSTKRSHRETHLVTPVNSKIRFGPRGARVPCNQILPISIIPPGLEEGDGLLEAAQVQHADRHVVDHDDVRLRGGRGGGGVRALQRGQGGREVAGRDGEHGGVEEAVDGALVAATCGGRPGLLGLFEIALRRLNVTCTRVD